MLAIAIVFTLIIICGQIFAYPSDLQNIVTGQFNESVRLHYPLTYVLFAPFFQFADRVTILGTSQHIAFGSTVCLVWIAWRIGKRWGTALSLRMILIEIGGFLCVNLVLFLMFLVVAFIPRPMARIHLDGKDLLAFNIHSHTSASWDARKSFSPMKNLLWHERAGFHANFITDHNVFHGSQEGRDLSLSRRPRPGMISMRGEELTLFRSHWILLGSRTRFYKKPHEIGYEGLNTFLQVVSPAKDQIVVASLPQYWRDHWDNVDDFIAWGVHGFEIVSASPRALDFPPRLRSQIVELCRKNNLLMMGGADSHGLGSTVYVWNLVRFPDWRGIPPEQLEEKLIKLLQQERFKAVQVVVRHKAVAPDRPWMLAFDPLLQVWEGARSLPKLQALSFLLWIWVPWTSVKLVRRRKPRTGDTSAIPS
ncbi:MAG: hypothetical protein GTO40_14580 [Deltaproteobacteria bacterium]|nr:hypothetical protein [Deltaproteobacteria bacterium]